MMRPPRPQPPPPPSMRCARCRSSISVRPPVRPCVQSLKPRCLPHRRPTSWPHPQPNPTVRRRLPHRDPVGAQPLTNAVQRTVAMTPTPQPTHRAPRRSSSSVRPAVRPCVRSLRPRCLQHRRPTSWPHPQPNPTVRPRLTTSSPVGAQPLTNAVQRTAVDAVAAPEATDAPRTASVFESNRPESPSIHTDSGATMAAVRDDAVLATPPPSLPVTTASPSITAVTTSALPLANAVQRNAVSDGGGEAATVRPIVTPMTSATARRQVCCSVRSPLVLVRLRPVSGPPPCPRSTMARAPR